MKSLMIDSGFYVENGYLVDHACLGADELAIIIREVTGLFGQDTPGRQIEPDGSVQRIFGPHLVNDAVSQLVRHPRLVSGAKQLLGGPVYLHQSKLIAKPPFVSIGFSWHQDYAYWRHADHIPTGRIATAMIFLDDVTEFNGPLFVVPKSHRRSAAESPTLADPGSSAYGGR